MLIWEFFYFLWDDPLFRKVAGDPKDYISDPEFIEMRREARLLALEHLYLQIEMLQQRLRQEKQIRREGEAREVWTINQFLEVVSDEHAERILINRKVNSMDQDFSFADVLTKQMANRT